jgi:hypothetical protein
MLVNAQPGQDFSSRVMLVVIGLDRREVREILLARQPKNDPATSQAKTEQRPVS